jgi:hypothetical protein
MQQKNYQQNYHQMQQKNYQQSKKSQKESSTKIDENKTGLCRHFKKSWVELTKRFPT